MLSIRNKRRTPERARPRGVVTVLAAILSIVLMGMVAFAVDIGYLLSVKEELQRTADASALAACWDYNQKLVNGNTPSIAEQSARLAAADYAGSNVVSLAAPSIDANLTNDADGDLVFGRVNDLYNPSVELDTSAADIFNAVRVTVRRNEELNGQAPFFFARVFGLSGSSLEATATAAIVRDIRGFQATNNGATIDLLPFALDLETWTAWVDGVGEDNYSWDAQNGIVVNGPDGVLEVNLYPQGTGSPGNRGTVDIGSNNNSTRDIARQILHGVNASDLSYHGGVLQFDSNGELFLNGDTGISAGVKDELTEIMGQPRIIPIFSKVVGPGNNAIYTIVRWYGIRIVDVRLTGPYRKKHVTIQAAPIVAQGVVPSTTVGTSGFVYSPAVLLQ